MRKDQVITLRIDKDLKDKLSIIARLHRISVSDLIRILIEQNIRTSEVSAVIKIKN